MKYSHLKKTIIWAAAILIISGIFSLYQNIDSFSLAAGKTSQKLDRLFGDMGVLPHPYLTEPVDITLKNISGKEVRLSDFKGNIVFINFWTTW